MSAKFGKIVQLAVVAETEETYGALFVLTEEGKIVHKFTDRNAPHQEWKEILTEEFVKRRGDLI